MHIQVCTAVLVMSDVVQHMRNRSYLYIVRTPRTSPPPPHTTATVTLCSYSSTDVLYELSTSYSKCTAAVLLWYTVYSRNKNNRTAVTHTYTHRRREQMLQL